MNKYRVFRFGSLGVAAHRYIDLLNDPRMDKITIFLNQQQKNEKKEFLLGLDFFNLSHLSEKVEFIDYELSFFDKILNHIMYKRGWVKLPHFISCLFYRKLKNKIRPDCDIVWFGDNDFDNSNALNYALLNIFKTVKVIKIKTYKETRYKWKWGELLAIKSADGIVFPHESYICFFEKIYKKKIGLADKIVGFSDLDQRSNYQTSWLRNLNKGTKYSDENGVSHVAIVVGRAACFPCERSGSRYVLKNSIFEMLERGIEVRLFVKHIIHSISNPKVLDNNVYRDMEIKYKNFKISTIEMKLGSTVYDEISKCDFGLLHNSAEHENESLLEFQKINIANRMYEYLSCNLIPIIEKNKNYKTLQESVTEEFGGFLYRDYDELHGYLNTWKSQGENIYNDFPNVFFETIEAIYDKKSIK